MGDQGVSARPRQDAIEARWGVPFWDLLRDLCDQGLSRPDAARALGYESRTELQNFYRLLARNPAKDPWPRHIKIATQYVIDTGESFRDACQRLARTHTITQAAREIGFADCGAFIHAMRSRGFRAEFPVKHKRRHPIYA